MLTLKIEIDKPKKDGTSPLYLRITQNRKHRRVPIGVYIAKSDFNPKGGYEKKNWIRTTHANHAQLNQTIAYKIEEAQKVRNELKGDAHRETISKALTNQNKGLSNASFISFADEYVERFKDVEYNTYRGKKSSLNKFKEYLKLRHHKDLLFSEVSLTLVKDYEKYLITNLKNNPNTTEKELSRLRAIVNDAIKHENMPMEKNPFLRIRLKKEKSEKIRLSEKEIEQLVQLPLPTDSLICHVRNAYLFSFYCAGIRCGDLLQLRWSCIQDNRIVYQMNKTSLPVSLKLPKQALLILDQYTIDRSPESFIFPFFNSQKDYSENSFLKKEVSAKNALLNKYLKMISEKAGINKPLSMHTARHTFADVGRKKTKDVYAISKALGHTSIRVTQAYLSSFDTETVDNALDTIFDF